MNKWLKSVLPTLLLLPVACASLAPAPEFTSVSFSMHFADGGQGAERSIGADGVVSGSHLTRTRAAPLISMSKELARPEDVAEIAALAGGLRGGSEASPARPAGAAYDMLAIRYADGRERTFYRVRPAGDFEPAAVARLVRIIRSYRAGYW